MILHLDVCSEPLEIRIIMALGSKDGSYALSDRETVAVSMMFALDNGRSAFAATHHLLSPETEGGPDGNVQHVQDCKVRSLHLA